MKRSFTIYTLGLLVMLLALPHASRAQSATPANPAIPATPAKPATKSETTKTKTHTTKYDLNTASKDQLMKLAGVDDATADKIIAARPYKSKKDLVSKNVMSQSEYDRIHQHVMVKSNTQAAPKKTGR
jgi:competence protein ComEA